MASENGAEKGNIFGVSLFSFTFVSIIFLDVQNTLKWNGMEPKIIRFSISSIIVNYLMGYW
jgi:hypothetical protein